MRNLSSSFPRFELQCYGGTLGCIPAPVRNEEGGDGIDSCPIPDTTRDRITKGNLDNRNKNGGGGFDKANGDFDALGLSGVSDKGNGVRVGTLPDGRTVVVRPDSDNGRGPPTIDIQRGDGTRIKIRYGP